jgi:hypothetical protein
MAGIGVSGELWYLGGQQILLPISPLTEGGQCTWGIRGPMLAFSRAGEEGPYC